MIAIYRLNTHCKKGLNYQHNVTSPTSNFLIGVGFGYNTFVAAGTLGNILRSTDNGSSWDNATSPTPNQLRGVGF